MYLTVMVPGSPARLSEAHQAVLSQAGDAEITRIDAHSAGCVKALAGFCFKKTS